MSQSQAILVPTITSKPAVQEVHLRGLNSESLAKLKQTDTFLYHSIPEVHKADMSLWYNYDSSNKSPSLESTSKNTKVVRKTRISYECHETMLMADDLLDDKEFNESGIELDVILDELYSLGEE